MRVGNERVRQYAVDLGIAVAVLAITLVYAVTHHTPRWPHFDSTAVVLTVAVNLPLALRRRRPWTVLLVSSAALVTYTAAGYQPTVNVWSPMLAFLTVASVNPPRKAAPGAALATAVWIHHALSAGTSSLWLAVAETLAFVTIVWGIGYNQRRLRQSNRRLALLTERLRQQEGALARQAVTEERLRLARELHDVVTHHLSVVSLHSGLARLVCDKDSHQTRDALSTIEAATHRALADMRGLLHVLRMPQDDADGSGAHADRTLGVQDVAALADLMDAVGLNVTMTVTGTPRPLMPHADLCAYRIVQEALTNVLRHAGAGTRVVLSIDHGTAGLAVAVRDEGGPRKGAPAPAHEVLPGVSSGGRGLEGMQERARLHGGEFHAGPRQPKGYEVVFTLPHPYLADDDEDGARVHGVPQP
ncbi:histidine kinase [Streptomyces sp. NPDC003032]